MIDPSLWNKLHPSINFRPGVLQLTIFEDIHIPFHVGNAFEQLYS